MSDVPKLTIIHRTTWKRITLVYEFESWNEEIANAVYGKGGLFADKDAAMEFIEKVKSELEKSNIQNPNQ